MAINKMINIEVAYAGITQQKVIELSVQESSTIHDAIMLSNLLAYFPEIDLTQYKVGVFSKRKELTDIVQDGDRVEIYRPLTIDPKEARRVKAKSMKDKPQ